MPLNYDIAEPHIIEFKEEYFQWLYDIVCTGRANSKVSYRKMFKLLHSIPFKYSIRNDINRAVDGVDLRNRFIVEMNYSDDFIDLLRAPCSVLEMMVALAIRCEETIMDDTRYGNRIKQWFWSMMSNLEISFMTDDIYKEEYIKKRIDIFLNHEYEPNGKGGLFYIRNCEYDLREEEIWTQLCWYLDNID